jgi:large subunit ribosomal protein L24
MKNAHVKRDDLVVVISGEDRGKMGKVLATYPAKNRVLVEGINVIKKALRKSQDNPRGGMVTKEAPIQISKVMKQAQYEARRKKRGATVVTAEA